MLAHAGDGGVVECGVQEGGAQKLDRRAHVFGEHLRRYGDAVAIGVVGKACSQCFGGLQEFLGVHIARALFERCGHKVCCAFLAFGIEAAAAAKVQLKCDDGDGMLFDEPDGDAAGGDEFLNVRCCAGGQGCDEQDKECCDGADHWVVSCDCINQPVTELFLSKTSLAASMTSSASTLARISGQSCTSCTVKPEVSAAP